MGVGSIRHKLQGLVLGTTLAAVLVSLMAIATYDLSRYHRNVMHDMQAQADMLGQMSVPALSVGDPELARQNLDLLRVRAKVRAAAIYNERGALFAAFLMPGEAASFPRQPGLDQIRVDGNQLELFKRLEHDGVVLGTVYLRADYELDSRVLDYLEIGAVAIVIAMLIAYLLLERLQKVVLEPITSITEVAREVVEKRNYSFRARQSSDDEISVLVTAFNDMLAEIERRTSELESSNRAIVREVRERDLAQQEVMRLNAELERRVRERTEQLEIANHELGVAIEAAQRASNSKSSFLSSMSHELRTPLNAILGFAQILVSESLPSTLQQKKEFAGHILKAGRHLLTLINEILDLAKIESGTMNLSLELVELGDLLHECQTMIEPQADARRVSVLFPQTTELAALADRTRLKQIMLNLLSNAVKYNRERGSVLVSCSVTGYDRVRIAVQDTGSGLSPEQLDGLFQPFNRLGQEGGAEEGTGIGLVVTKRLVEAMGGDIGVSSTVGTGSVFWVELKLAIAAPRPEKEPALRVGQSGPHGAAYTLLYVEDNPANLRLVEEIIQFRHDIRLLSAPDAQHGIDLANAELPDVILMDIHLPGMSGIDALAILRHGARTAKIPVIAITANALPRDVERGLELGFFRYLSKPINLDEFNEALKSALAYSAHDSVIKM
jgi:signal transduction histidine kinase/ActR/RegA family two-component response regulator